MREVAIIRIYVDEETGEYVGRDIWHDPKDHPRALLEAALAAYEEPGGTEQ